MSFSKKNQRILGKLYQKWRIKLSTLLSTFSGKIIGNPLKMQPIQLVGKGIVVFGKNTQIGYYPAPNYYNGLCYLEVRNINAQITFGENTTINNNLIIICDSTSVTIGSNAFIGHDVEILDSDLHSLDSVSRNQNGAYISASVCLGENVFIGNCVKILKGVHIGNNSVIAHSSVVTKSFPNNVIIGGNPAKIIGTII